MKYIFNKVGDDSPILKYQDKLIGTIQSAGTDSNSHKVLEKKYFSKNGNSYLTPPEDKSYTKEYFIVDINDAFKSLG